MNPSQRNQRPAGDALQNKIAIPALDELTKDLGNGQTKSTDDDTSSEA